MVRNMQNPELSPAASPTELCQDRAAGPMLWAAPPSACHKVRDVVLLAHSPSGSLSWQSPHREPSLDSHCLCPAWSPWWRRGICLYSCENWEWEASMWPPLPRGESRQGKHGRESQGCWKERGVVFTHTRAPWVISCRINSARANSRADTYLWFREVYLC